MICSILPVYRQFQRLFLFPFLIFSLPSPTHLIKCLFHLYFGFFAQVERKLLYQDNLEHILSKGSACFISQYSPPPHFGPGRGVCAQRRSPSAQMCSKFSFQMKLLDAKPICKIYRLSLSTSRVIFLIDLSFSLSCSFIVGFFPNNLSIFADFLKTTMDDLTVIYWGLTLICYTFRQTVKLIINYIDN